MSLVRSMKVCFTVLIVFGLTSVGWAGIVTVVQWTSIQNDMLEASVFELVPAPPSVPPTPPTEKLAASKAPMTDTQGTMNYIYGDHIRCNNIAVGEDAKYYVKRKVAGAYTLLVSSNTIAAH